MQSLEICTGLDGDSRRLGGKLLISRAGRECIPADLGAPVQGPASRGRINGRQTLRYCDSINEDAVRGTQVSLEPFGCLIWGVGIGRLCRLFGLLLPGFPPLAEGHAGGKARDTGSKQGAIVAFPHLPTVEEAQSTYGSKALSAAIEL